MEELSLQVKNEIDKLALEDSVLEKRKRELSEQNHAAKQYMANAFEELHRRIE